MSIASEMTQLATNKVAIKQAILLKSPVTQPGDDMSDWAASIASIPSEVRTEGNLDDNDVIFCDYDGTVLHTYSRSEVSSMESLPQLPTQTGMEYQGWNWTLNGLKQQALQVGKALVSAICKPADDCTKVTITIPDAKYSEVPMRFLSDSITRSRSQLGRWFDCGNIRYDQRCNANASIFARTVSSNVYNNLQG